MWYFTFSLTNSDVSHPFIQNIWRLGWIFTKSALSGLIIFLFCVFWIYQNCVFWIHFCTFFLYYAIWFRYSCFSVHCCVIWTYIYALYMRKLKLFSCDLAGLLRFLTYNFCNLNPVYRNLRIIFPYSAYYIPL